jgi:alpha-aminoadipic semialdehyde synthase
MSKLLKSLVFNDRSTLLFTCYRYSSSKPISIGIRAETKNRWERRVPLIPNDVKKLVDETGIQVFVESSNKRVFTDDEYIKVNLFSNISTQVI